MDIGGAIRNLWAGLRKDTAPDRFMHKLAEFTFYPVAFGPYALCPVAGFGQQSA